MKRIRQISGRIVKERAEGAALIEFALVLPIIITVVGGIIDLGFLLLTMHNIHGIASDGAHLAAMIEDYSEDPSSVVEETVLANDSKISYVSKITKVTVTKNSASLGSGFTDCDDIVTVSVEASHNFYFLNLIGFSDSTIRRKANMRWLNQQLCG